MEEEDFSGDSELDQLSDAGDEVDVDVEEEQWGGGSRSSSRASQQSRSSTPDGRYNQDSTDMGAAEAAELKETDGVGDNKPNDAEGEATSTTVNDSGQMAEGKGKKRRKKTPQQPGEKKKRKKKEGGEKKKKKSKPGHLRRNIRKLKAEDALEAETLAAQQEEMERKRRLEMQRSQNLPTPGFMAEDMDLADLDFSTGQLDFSNLMEAEAELAPSMYTEPAIPVPVPTPEQPTTCTSTEEPTEPKLEPTPDEKPTEDVSVPKVTPPPVPMMPQQADDSDDVICLDSSSGDEESTEKDSKPAKTTKSPGEDVVEVGSSDDDVMIVSGDDEDQEEEEEEEEDMGNSGSHTDDATNQPDALGRVLINVNHPSTESDIFLSRQLGRSVKPHQIGGIRFLYDNLVESLERYKSSGGFGCILAHSMGLGKTLQLISFIDVFLRHTEAKTVLCIVPINTLQNWSAEFNMWLPTKEAVDAAIQQGIAQEGEIQHREFGVYLLNDNYRTNLARAKLIDKWFKTGGVLLMGYEMYRLLISKKIMLTNNKKRRGKQPKDMEVIDLEQEDTNLAILHGVHKALARPGPDLVICDEGHRIKNAHTSVSQTLKNIRTKRRVVLTGYPLQNNLMEYWCMVDFVRPNFLGTRQEFSNMFERPIQNGQCIDSTPEDVRYMRYRAHVLHSLLEGFVQRRGHAVLKSVLPPKYEHVLLVRMSAIQRQLYAKFMTAFRESGAAGWSNNNPLRAFSVCCKIWNHPDILYEILQKKMTNDDLDIEDAEALGNKSRSRSNTPTIPDGSKRSGSPAVPLIASTSGVTDENSNSNSSMKDRRFTQDVGLTPFQEKLANQSTNYNWAEDCMKDYTPGVLENGGKMLLLFKIIEQSIRGGDKLLVYSQSLNTLSLIEEFLAKTPMPEPPTGFPPNIPLRWAKNKTYYRLDGSTSGQEREKMINQFNAPNSPTWLFLLSTRAGCLGVNLVGANRVVVFDASWNPCHDCQAVCRVYRYGQTKPSHIYRLVTDKSLEKKIYDRQVNKQGMSDRVVDELQPESNFTRKEVEDLFSYDDSDPVYEDFSQDATKFADPILQDICTEHSKLITKAPFQHESLLIDRKDHKLTKAEKRAAKKSYEQEKRMSISNYSRPSYSAFYPQQQSAGTPGSSGGTASISSLISFARAQTGMPMIHRPVANVRPIQSTPIPMQPRTSGSSDVQVFQRGGHNIMVNHVKTTMDIPIPGSASSSSTVQKIPAGTQITVIRTHRGMYIRTNDGKIFAVRAGAPGMSQVLHGSQASVSSNHGNQGIPVQSAGPSLSATAVNEAIGSATASSAPPGQSFTQSVATSAPMVSALLSGTPSLESPGLGCTSPMTSVTTSTTASGSNVAGSSEAAATRQGHWSMSTAEVSPFLTTSSKEPSGDGKQDGNSSEADKSMTQRPESTGGLSSGSSQSRPASQNLERTSPISQAADSSVPAVTSSGVPPSIPPLVSQQTTTQSGGVPNFSFPAPSQALNMNIPGMGNISPSPLQNLMTFVPSYLNPGSAQPQPGMIPSMYNYPGMMPPFGLVAAPLPFLPSAPPPNMQATLGNAVPLSGYPPQPGMAIPTSTATTSQEAPKSTEDNLRSSPFNFDDIVQLD